MVARVGIPAVNTCQKHGDGSVGIPEVCELPKEVIGDVIKNVTPVNWVEGLRSTHCKLRGPILKEVGPRTSQADVDLATNPNPNNLPVGRPNAVTLCEVAVRDFVRGAASPVQLPKPRSPVFWCGAAGRWRGGCGIGCSDPHCAA